MQFHTDHYFVIGQAHVSAGKPCQDHALSGIIQSHPAAVERAFAVVSDGCSGGGNTDIGSRLITTSTVKALKMVLPDDREFSVEHPETVAEISAVLVNTASQHLGLNSRDLLATQLFAVVEPSGKCFVSIYGDGTIVYVDQDGGIAAYTYEWKDNFPFYPHEDRRLFIERHGGRDSPALAQTVCQINPDGEVTLTLETTLSVEAGCNGVTFFTDTVKQKTAFICLFTDGVMQVGRVDPHAETERVDPLEVLRNSVAFKNLSGEFLKRRLIRYIRDSKVKGIGPLDDFGAAVIAITHET